MSSMAIMVAAAFLAVAPPQEANATASAAQSQLASLFETPSDVIVTPGGMMVASPPSRMVMLVRRSDDGSLETICVESAEAAERFLHAKTKMPDSRTVEEK